MRVFVPALIAFALISCSQADTDRAREQARDAGEKLRVESKQALHEAATETRKASRELNNDLEKARDKTRRALDQPDTNPPKDSNPR